MPYAPDPNETEARIAYLQHQIRVLQNPTTGSERDALTKAQHRADSVSAMLGQKVSAPIPGEKPLDYRKRILAPLLKYSVRLKDARLDSMDRPTLDAVEGMIFADAVAAARNGDSVPAGQMREITERDAAGRLISKFYGDPLAWMTPFMGAGRVARINKTSDRSD